MTNAYVSDERIRNQELYRAREVIKVAEAAGKEIGSTLRDYGVPSSIIDELGIKVEPVARRGRKSTTKDKLEQWVKEHIGQTINGGKQISEDLGISYPTANNFIQSRRDVFAKVKKGIYIVKDAELERQASKQ